MFSLPEESKFVDPPDSTSRSKQVVSSAALLLGLGTQEA